MKPHSAGNDIGDLFVWMAMGLGFVARHEPMQRHRCAAAGERLLLDALADLFPLRCAPVDFVNVHGLVSFYLAARSSPVGRKNMNKSRIDNAATFLDAAPRNRTASACAIPSTMPPTSAPSGRPKPPTIAAMKPLIA